MYIRHITYVTYVTYVINVNFGIHTGHEAQSPGPKSSACLTHPPPQHPSRADFSLFLLLHQIIIIFSL